MRRSWLFMLVGILLLLVSVPALAGIDNTHHSLKDYYTSGTTRYTCFSCHGYPNPSGQTSEALLGRVGNFCYLRCHGGSGGLAGTDAEPGPGIVAVVGSDNSLTTSASASSGLNAIKYGHGLDWGSFPDKDTGTLPSWPYTDTAGFMECTSCHDIHNNTYAPFLRAQLSAQATDNEHADASLVTDVFCIKCHTGGTSGAGRYNVITAAPNGVHPVEMYGDNTHTSWTGTQYSGSARGPRRIDLKSTVFETATLAGTALNGAKGNSWTLGGKLGGTDNGVVGCYTCHSVHMDVISATGSAKAVEPTGQTFKNLTVMAYADNNLSTASNDDLCIGCHGATSQVANPGITAYYHPAGSETDNTVTGAGTATASYTVSTGSFDITVDMSGKVYGTQGRLLCTSCHAPAHADNPVAGSLLLNPSVPDGCDSCHNLSSPYMGTAPDSHHVYGTTKNYTSSGNGGMPEPNYASDYSNASITDGLQCWDCHVKGTDTAHNWE